MKKLIILFLFLSLFLTGCYDYKELSDLALTTAVGIDYKDNKYILTIQVVDTNNEDNNYYTYSNSGKTIQEAFRKMINSNSKRVYGSQINLLVISEELARKNISKVIDFFFRDKEVRTEIKVLLTNDINGLLNKKEDLEKLNSKYIEEMLDNIEHQSGKLHTVTFNDMLNMYLDNNIILPCIKFVDDNIKPYKMGLFKNNKLVGYQSESDTIGYNILNNNFDKGILTIPYNSDYYSIDIIESKSSYSFKNNIFSINIDIDSNLNEIDSNTPVDKDSVIKSLEDKTSLYIKKLVQSTIDINKKYTVDTLKITDYIKKNYYNYYKKNKIDINKLQFKIKVDTNITNKGSGLKVITNED